MRSRIGPVALALVVLAGCGPDEAEPGAANAAAPRAAVAPTATVTDPSAPADPDGCSVLIVSIAPEASDADIDAVGARLRADGVDPWFVDQVEAFRELTGDVFDSEGQTNVMIEPEQLPTSHRAVIDPADGAELIARYEAEPDVFAAEVVPGTAEECARA